MAAAHHSSMNEATPRTPIGLAYNVSAGGGKYDGVAKDAMAFR